MGKHSLPEDRDRLQSRASRIGAVALRRIGLGALLILSTYTGWALVNHQNLLSMLRNHFIPAPAQVFGKTNLLVLVEGLDYDYTANDVEYSTNSRSDVIWAVNLDLEHKRIFQLSVPRDMVATLPDGTQAKINQAQSDGGVKEAQQVIGGWLGIPGFDKYMVLRIDAAKDLIAAVGGVDVYVKNSDCLRYNTNCTGKAINYDDSWGHLHVHLKEGMQHLDGSQAVGYMRFRHDWCSDPCRIMRQQQVLHALADKIRNDRLNTLLNAGSLLAVFRKDVQTNFTDEELLSLANYFADMPPGSLMTRQVPYVSNVYLPGYGDSILPDTAARAQLVQDMLIDPPAPEASPDALALGSVQPSAVRVDVENGTGTPGLAHSVATRLSKAGFVVVSVGNAPTLDHKTSEIRDHSTVAFAGIKVRDALPSTLQDIPVLSYGADATQTGAPNPATSATPDDVILIVGDDYSGKKPNVRPTPHA